MTFPVLHIHAQAMWHDEADIIGNREGLEQLRDAIGFALGVGSGASTVFCADGEGYTVRVRLRDKPMDDPAWEEARLPYTDPMAGGGTDVP